MINFEFELISHSTKIAIRHESRYMSWDIQDFPKMTPVFKIEFFSGFFCDDREGKIIELSILNILAIFSEKPCMSDTYSSWVFTSGGCRGRFAPDKISWPVINYNRITGLLKNVLAHVLSNEYDYGHVTKRLLAARVI